MKKSIIAIVLAVATLVTFIIPASAWTWEEDGKFEVASYDVAIVEEGTIAIDGKLEAAYTDSQKIVSDNVNIFKRTIPDYSSIWSYGLPKFFAYIVVDVTGMYIYVEIEDTTIFDVLDTDPQSGDHMQIYFDWCPAEQMHPTSAQMYADYLLDGTTFEPDKESWSTDSSYKLMWGINGFQYIGNISYDYQNNVRGVWGFGPAQALGLDGSGMVETYTELIPGGWKLETFIPWRDELQKEAIARGEQFHCGIGLSAGDDTDIDDFVTPGVQQDVVSTFDQRHEIGGNYWNCYSSLADLRWGEYPEGYFDAVGGGSEPADVIDTSDAILAVVASLAVAGAGVVLFSKKRTEEN